MTRWACVGHATAAIVGHVYVCFVLDSTERFNSDGFARSLEAEHVFVAEGQCFIWELENGRQDCHEGLLGESHDEAWSCPRL